MSLDTHKTYPICYCLALCLVLVLNHFQILDSTFSTRPVLKDKFLFWGAQKQCRFPALWTENLWKLCDFIHGKFMVNINIIFKNFLWHITVKMHGKLPVLKKAFNVSHFMAIKPLNLWAKHQNTQWLSSPFNGLSWCFM